MAFTFGRLTLNKATRQSLCAPDLVQGPVHLEGENENVRDPKSCIVQKREVEKLISDYLLRTRTVSLRPKFVALCVTPWPIDLGLDVYIQSGL